VQAPVADADADRIVVHPDREQLPPSNYAVLLSSQHRRRLIDAARKSVRFLGLRPSFCTQIAHPPDDASVRRADQHPSVPKGDERAPGS
jgi:hypothetical protein